jgi:hypothetical protein
MIHHLALGWSAGHSRGIPLIAYTGRTPIR